MTVVKVRTIHQTNFSGVLATTDRRYNTKLPLKKICKYCLKNGFSFQVGFRENTIIPNKNYIEIICEAFLHFCEDDYEYYLEKEKNLEKWLKKPSNKFKRRNYDI